MKQRRYFKRIAAFLLIGSLLAGCLCGCSGSDKKKSADKEVELKGEGGGFDWFPQKGTEPVDATTGVPVDTTPTEITEASEATEPTTEPTTAPTEPAQKEYCLVGRINGTVYGCESDYANVGEYIFVDGTLVATFTSDSYIFIKTTDNNDWYMAKSYCDGTSATFRVGDNEKMFVPGNVELTFTLEENEDGSLTLSYEAEELPTEPTEPPTEATEPTEEFPDTIYHPLDGEGEVTASVLNVRESPSRDAEIVGTLERGHRVAVYGHEYVDGEYWGSLDYGWINMQYVALDNDVVGTWYEKLGTDSGTGEERYGFWTFDESGSFVYAVYGFKGEQARQVSRSGGTFWQDVSRMRFSFEFGEEGVTVGGIAVNNPGTVTLDWTVIGKTMTLKDAKKTTLTRGTVEKIQKELAAD